MGGGAYSRVDVAEHPLRALFVRGLPPSDPRVVEDLRDWAGLQPQEADVRGALDPILTLDGIMVAAGSGVVGNAAWSLFPAAADWLTKRWRAPADVDASAVVEAIRACLDRIEPGVGAGLLVDRLQRGGDGVWRAEVSHERCVYRVKADALGEIVHITRLDKA